MKKCFWLRVNLLWQEVTQEEFLQAKRSVFSHVETDRDDPVDFYSVVVQGRVTYAEITEKNYGWDPDFLKATQEKKQ